MKKDYKKKPNLFWKWDRPSGCTCVWILLHTRNWTKVTSTQCAAAQISSAF